MKKRTKQVENMIDEVNKILRDNRVVNERDDRFWVMHWLLLQEGIYRGYNWYYEKEYTDVMGKTETIVCGCGTGDFEKVKEMDGFLQLL